MKIRIAPGTLALRLSGDDLPDLERDGTLVETLRMGQDPEAHLRWVLEVVEVPDSESDLAVHMDGPEVRISISPALLVRLSEDERAAEQNEVEFADGSTTRIVVERDLKPHRRH